MHRFNIGDEFAVFCDNWVTTGPGRQTNHHKPAAPGVVLDIDFIEGKDVVTLEDGRVFQRYEHYCATSPYGWNQA